MNHDAGNFALLMFVMSMILLMSVPIQALMKHLALPPMVGFIGLGIGLSVLNSSKPLIPTSVTDQITMLGQLGVLALLFRVGLESDLSSLLSQLRRATLIWLPNMLVPAALAFALIWAWPGLGLLPAMLIGIAASATSIGVSVAVWKEAGKANTDDGALLLDVAALDDLSTLILLGIIYAVVPLLHAGTSTGSALLWETFAATGIQLAKIAVFCVACYVFSEYLEQRLTRQFARLNFHLGPFVFAAGAVFLIGALAEGLGLSMAVGALFAGLAFSRDPAERRIDVAFGYFLALFEPFFFVSIGLSVALSNVGPVLVLAASLLIVLVMGKLIGAGVPAAMMFGRRTGLLIGASMVPRAEIFLIVVLHGFMLGPWAMPPTLYAAAVLAGIGTCVIGPLIAERLLLTQSSRGKPI
ncbi:MAG: cation:proton antiporter [Burkholderiaceae bacterium]